MPVRRQDSGVGAGRAARRKRVGQIVWQNSASPRLRGDKPAPGLGADEEREIEMNGKFLQIGNQVINPDHIVSAKYDDKEPGQEYLKLTLDSIEPATTYDGDPTGGCSSVKIKFSGAQAIALWRVLETESYMVIT